MYCGKCGKEISDDAVKCVHCGCPVESANNVTVESAKNNVTVQSDNDNGGIGWLVLGVLFPILGLLLYLYFLGSRPRSAKHAGSGALVGFLGALTILFAVILIGNAAQWGFTDSYSRVVLIIAIPTIVAAAIVIAQKLVKKIK